MSKRCDAVRQTTGGWSTWKPELGCEMVYPASGARESVTNRVERKLMNKLRKAGEEEAERHPRQLLRISLFAERHRKGVSRTIKTARRASQLTRMVRRTAGNPKVQAETRLAVSDLVGAVQRARRVGMPQALADGLFAEHLRHASTHASEAMAASRSTRPRHSIARATAIIVGACLLAGAIYAGWRTYLRLAPRSSVSRVEGGNAPNPEARGDEGRDTEEPRGPGFPNRDASG